MNIITQLEKNTNIKEESEMKQVVIIVNIEGNEEKEVRNRIEQGKKIISCVVQ